MRSFFKVNILISQSHRACLADFGLATTKDTMSFMITTTITTRTTGTLRWQAPELLDPDLDEHKCNNSSATDIYAYGCVCYEVCAQLPNRHFVFDNALTDIFRSIAFPQSRMIIGL
jgi:serine/threonine protein kinase